jgi:hypothetical protein
MADDTVNGMTPQGVIPKRPAQIIADLNDNLARIVDAQTGERAFRNASDDSFLQQILSVFAEGLSECWEAACDASGVGLALPGAGYAWTRSGKAAQRARVASGGLP